jgi:hypothetical protein
MTMDSFGATTFTGFSPDTLEFLRVLAANNRNEFFLLAPLYSYLTALSG